MIPIFIEKYLPTKIRPRILLFGFLCGFLAASFASVGVGAIINRRAEIAETTWIGPVIARVYEDISRMPLERRLLSVGNFNRSDAVQFALVKEHELRDAQPLDSYFLLNTNSQYGPNPRIYLDLLDRNPRQKVLKSDYPPEDLTAKLTFLVSAIARHDSRAMLYIPFANGERLVVSSPKYWQARITEVQWLLICLAGMAFSGVLYAVGTRALLRPFKILSENSNELNTLNIKWFWPEEAKGIAYRLSTEQKEKAEVLDERTRMLTAISHDLRTPATRLRLRAEYIEDESLRNKILSDLDLMLGMTRDAIDFLKGGLEREEEEYFEIVSLVQSICADFSDVGMPVIFMPIQYPTLRTTGTVFSSHEKSVPLDGMLKGNMKGRPKALQRAITDLVANAVKYGFQAKVSLTIEPSRVLIEVMDKGPGIPEDEMENVLKPFYRLEKSRNRETGGSGLGLSIVNSVIQAHHGHFDLINLPVQGLNATVDIPRSIETT
ncbi:HAMP domain-containing sensor histidine kinase [uncultured Kiloniella sp.]|uniref:sensor histidine kinase n=1 Tax=uncultured Kiloniella sp. TaxID=1133091 RepID=UPI002602DDCF|nr:HAMP domain-containing sensor histidine kinase [uncultured Kiloniella sp.]